MPLPQQAAPQPRGEEFEQLIHELSAEFHRLQHRINDLSRENSDLRSSASANGQDGGRSTGGKAKGKGAANEARCLKTTLACVEGDKTGNGLSPLLAPGDEPPDGNGKHSAWRRHTPAIGKVRTKSTEFDLANDYEGNKSAPQKRISMHSAATSNGAGTVVSVPSVTFRKSRTSLGSNAHFQRLRGKFEYIDYTGMGKLNITDLTRFMDSSNEPVEREILVDLIRVFNDLEPLGGANNGQPIEPDGLGIDFVDFLKLMDEHMPLDHATPDLKSCIFSFRRACNQIPDKVYNTSSFVEDGDKDTKGNGRSRKDKVKNFASFWLETIPTGVILLNTIMAGLAADYPKQEGIWDVFELIFVAFYTFEFAVKLRMYGCHGYFRGQDCMWNIFDFVCLSMSLTDLAINVVVAVVYPDQGKSDNAIFTMIKIFRLTRLARLLRTLRFKIFTELKMMVMGVMSGLRVLTWAIALLVMLVYVVGVGMTNMIGAYELEFNSVRASMFTLFRCWTEGCAAYDGTPLAERLRMAYGPLYMIFHILMTMFVTVGLFNLIMAIFIDNVVTNQLVRKHMEMVDRSSEIEMRLKSMFVEFINHGGNDRKATVEQQASLRRLVSRRADGAPNIEKEWEKMRELDVSITKDVFMAWLEDKTFSQLLDDAEIDTANRAELFDVLDADMGGQLCMDELITGLMKLRGSVTKSDIVAIRLKVRYLTSIIENKVLDEGTG